MQFKAVKDEVRLEVESMKAMLEQLSDYIYDNPEAGFQEHKACERLCEELELQGFRTERGVGELDTAFVATACPTGSASPRIDILAEYDALGLGTSFGEDYGVVHACGHNIIAATAIGSAVALSRVMGRHGISGTIRVVGAPAEEGGGGKALLQRAGVFDGSDLLLLLHPTSGTNKVAGACRSSTTLQVRYRGVAAHSGNHKERGINAEDAATICYVAIGCLRHQLPDDVQVFAQYANIGEARSLIPDEADMSVTIRAMRAAQLDATLARVKACAEAGALATGCEVEMAEKGERYYGRLVFPSLTEAVRRNFLSLGETVMDGAVDDNGGEDFGNLTYEIPGVMPYPTLLPARKISNHTPEFYRLCKSERAHDVLVLGSCVLAMTAIDALLDATLLESAWSELRGLQLQEDAKSALAHVSKR